MIKRILIGVTLLVEMVSAFAQTTQEWRDSLSVLNRMIEQSPKSLELRMRKAEANIMLEQWQYALDEYSSILDLYPTHIGALYFRAFVYNKQKKYAFARVDYEKVLGYEPDHMGALTGLIFVNMADNRKLEAFDESNHLVTLYPDKACVYAVRSQVEDSRGMVDMAIDDISMAISIEEKDMEPNHRLSFDEDYTQYVIQRIALYEKKGDNSSIMAADEDRKKLISKGLPSRILR